MLFGKNLQRIREEAGLSQSELARRSDSPIDSVRNWEQSKALPRIDAVARLARALSVTVDALVADVDFPRPGETATASEPAAEPTKGERRGQAGSEAKGKKGKKKGT